MVYAQHARDVFNPMKFPKTSRR